MSLMQPPDDSGRKKRRDEDAEDASRSANFSPQEVPTLGSLFRNARPAAPGLMETPQAAPDPDKPPATLDDLLASVRRESASSKLTASNTAEVASPSDDFPFAPASSPTPARPAPPRYSIATTPARPIGNRQAERTRTKGNSVVGCGCVVVILGLVLAGIIAGDSVEQFFNSNFSNVQEVGEISFGQTVSGTLGAGREHAYTFTGERGMVISLGVTTNTSGFDTYLTIRDSDNQPLVSDDDSGDGLNALICAFTLPYNGTYNAVLRGYNSDDEGNYQLTLGRADGERLETIEYGQTVENSLTGCSGRRYQLRVDEGERLRITATAARNASSMDLTLTLLDENGTQVAYNDDSDGLNPVIEYTNNARPQDFTILVRELQNDSGSFTLRAAEVRR